MLKLKASTLLYTVSITLLIALLLSGMILLSGYTKIQNNAIYFQELAQDNLESGKNLILYGDAEPFGEFSSNLYASPIDSYHVKSEVWGMYGLMHVTGVHGPAHARQSFLFGARPEGLFTASLFLEDRNRPLVIAGATILKGKLLLPEAGLKSGFIGRQGFTGPKLHDGPIANSADTPFDLHYPDLTQITTILDQVRNGSIPQSTSNSPQATNHKPHTTNNWQLTTILSNASEIILDQETTHTGKIILIAPKVTLRREAQISDIIIIANAVHIDSGFTGRLQIFANDSIIVEPQCRFNYPSALVLAPGNEFSRIIFGRKSEIHGLILADPNICPERSEGSHRTGQDQSIPAAAYVEIQKGATVVGNLIAMENLDLKGTAIGNVVTGKFRLLTPGAVYDNHLLDATITNEGLHPSYAMPLLQKKPTQYTEILQLGRAGL